MKNLILTFGILLLMMTGMVYDMDCRTVTEAERNLKWICEEAAYGAAVSLWRENGTTETAELAAAEILQKNLQLDGGMNPVSGAPFLGPVKWNLEMKDGIVKLYVDCGMADLRLPFLQGQLSVKWEEVFDFSEKFFGKRREIS